MNNTHIKREDSVKANKFRNHIACWEKSGLKQRAYCESVEITFPAFVYWRNKFAKKKNKQNPPGIPIFTQIKIKDELATPTVIQPIQSTENIKLTLKNGFILSFSPCITPSNLRDHLLALGAIS